jgi:hypothetical protein
MNTDVRLPDDCTVLITSTWRPVMLSSLSQLTPAQLESVKSLEKELGKTLLSYSSYDVVSDDLSESELQKVRELEKSLGTILVAVKAG